MAGVSFEVSSGRPIRVRVSDEDGKQYELTVAINVVDVRRGAEANADGTPRFDVDVQMLIAQKPLS